MISGFFVPGTFYLGSSGSGQLTCSEKVMVVLVLLEILFCVCVVKANDRLFHYHSINIYLPVLSLDHKLCFIYM